MANNSDTGNVNDHFFEGHYKEIWRSYIPDELTRRELEFILQYFDLKPGNKILDLMCGFGRHAIGLARKSMQVVAVDNLPDYIDEIQELAKRESLALKAVLSNILDFESAGKFDLAICMGNSLNFFDEESATQILERVAASLVEGGRILINSWSLAETVIKNFVEKSWSYSGDTRILVDSQYLFDPTRTESEFIFITQDGKTEKRKAIDYIFSLSEMQKMLGKAGLGLTEVYSIPGRKKFTVGEPRAYIIAEKKA